MYMKEILRIDVWVSLSDLLYKDHNSDQKFSITTQSPAGVVSFQLFFFLTDESDDNMEYDEVFSSDCVSTLFVVLVLFD